MYFYFQFEMKVMKLAFVGSRADLASVISVFSRSELMQKRT